MEITIETSSYNHRRMGRPWIATVDFTTAKGSFDFGDWTGDAYNGGSGVLSIDADAGEIIAKGQKDNRQPKNSAPEFFVLLPDGELENIGDKGDAYKYYLAHKNEGINTDALAEERAKLTLRITEIDNLLKEGKND